MNLFRSANHMCKCLNETGMPVMHARKHADDAKGLQETFSLHCGLFPVSIFDTDGWAPGRAKIVPVITE